MQDNAEDVEKGVRYSVNTYFRLKFIEPSAREVLFFGRKRKAGWGRKKTVDPQPL